MIDDGSDGFMLIGLHKMAAQNGDGLVPELYELLMRRAEEQKRAPNVTTFPTWKARRPDEMADRSLDETAHDGANVIAFAPDVDNIIARRKKV